jgi:histidinol-phosphate aminotransferase
MAGFLMSAPILNEHGGPDSLGVPSWDFSTNANACGPCPAALEAMAQADPRHYPDPTYLALRKALGAFHDVAPERIVLAASASECIARITAAVVRCGGQRVWLPAWAYGDYARAAQAWGMPIAVDPTQASLLWLCEPSSPRGLAEHMALAVAEQAQRQGRVVVLDRAYEPLRLSGRCSLNAAALDAVWQLWSPNKALGLTGVRGAYAVAPSSAQAEGGELLRTLIHLAPSWPLGAHGVAMLDAWLQPAAQAWLAQSRDLLRAWKARQSSLLQALNWVCPDSDANYLCARPPHALNVSALRAHGIKLRDTTSMGLAGYWRLSVQPPVAQDALQLALQAQVREQEQEQEKGTGS